MMANLPPARLAYQAPVFHRVGVDFFGPIFVRCGRRTEKRYGALFTCMTTRAVRIEIAHSLETDSYIMAMQRMMAKRGKPAHVWSDNGTNFVGAEKDIREAIERWNKEHIKDRCYRKMECNGSLIHQRHHTLVVYGSVLSGRRKPHLKQSPVNSV